MEIEHNGRAFRIETSGEAAASGGDIQSAEREFAAFLLPVQEGLESKAHDLLGHLLGAMGWFKADELGEPPFRLQWISILNFERKRFEMCFTLEGAEPHPWLDVYGLWSATFDGGSITGVRRDFW